MAISASTEYGRRLVPQILDSLVATDPDRILYSIAKFSDDSHEFRHISARAFAKAVDKTAWWLISQVGKSTSIQTVGYIGPRKLITNHHLWLCCSIAVTNYTKMIFVTYCWHTHVWRRTTLWVYHNSYYDGYCLGLDGWRRLIWPFAQALFLSPKNNTEGALAVLNSLNCNIWVKPCDHPSLPLVEKCLEQHPMKVLEMPLVDELLDAENTEPFPYTKTFDEATKDPFCFLHTSGSTGPPKPIAWSNGLVGTMDAVRLLPPTEGDDGFAPWTSDWKQGDRIYSAFPMSHVRISF